jgi:hypothetical protein
MVAPTNDHSRAVSNSTSLDRKPAKNEESERERERERERESEREREEGPKWRS